MTLEEKIIPYLPYGIEYYAKKESYKDFSISFEKKGVLTTKGTIHNINNIINSLGTNYFLALRPLSDLTKEIEVNGERFVPADILKNMVYEFDKTYISIVVCDSVLGRYISWQYDDNKTNRPVPYCVYQKLFEWHFDFFGLNKQGLTIEI